MNVFPFKINSKYLNILTWWRRWVSSQPKFHFCLKSSVMEEQLKLLTEQLKVIQERIDNLEKKQSQKKDESSKELRPSRNPATILTTEMNFDVWFRMITGELSALKYADLLEQLVNEKGEANYDPKDEITKGVYTLCFNILSCKG